jgi:lysophospholipase L1-like esterase
MRYAIFLLATAFTCCCYGQSARRVVALGSSTTMGAAATSNDSAWVGRLQAHFRKNTSSGDPDTIVTAMGGYGYTSYHLMPSDFVSPVSNRPAIDHNNNLTKALSLNPDLIIINLPSNDVASLYWSATPYSIRETMNNYRQMVQTARAAGVRCFVTTTQPRNDLNVEQKGLQKALRDSTLLAFDTAAINFWDDLVTNDGTNSLRNEVRNIGGADADYHLNNTGHRLIFLRAAAAPLFSGGGTVSPPPASTLRIEAEQYSAMSGIQTEGTSDIGGGQNVGYIDNGDWMDYVVTPPSGAGTYTVRARVASQMTGGQFQLRNTSGTVLATFSVPNTNGWQAWTTITATVSLPAGQQTLRILSVSAASWNINWLEQQLGGTQPPPPPPPSVTYTSLPARIEAEAYTAMNGIQTEGTTDAGGGQNLGYIDQGDWMEYPVSTSGGTFQFSARVASQMSGGQLQLRTTTGTVLATLTVPATGGWQSWTTVSGNVTLASGQYLVRVESVAPANWNINWLEFAPASGTPPPPPGYTAIPARLEAEAWSAMQGVQTEGTSDAGGGLNVGWIDQGDYLDYNISVATAGSYTLRLRIATPQSTAQVQVYSSTGQSLGAISLPNTGGWQSWQTVELPVTLVAGNQVLRVLSGAAGNWNINWLELVAVASEPAPGPAAGHLPIPAKIEAEAFTAMNGILLEGTSDIGGGQNVGWIDQGDWMEYKIYVPTTGIYDLKLRLATPMYGGQLQVRLQDGTVLATHAIQQTGGWQVWTPQMATVSLRQGNHTLRIVSTASANWNINWLELTATSNTRSVQPATLALSGNGAAPVALYPNPARESLTVTLERKGEERAVAEVLSSTGTVLKRIQLGSGRGTTRHQLSLGDLPAGSYLLRLITGETTVTRPFIKQ